MNKYDTEVLQKLKFLRFEILNEPQITDSKGKFSILKLKFIFYFFDDEIDQPYHSESDSESKSYHSKSDIQSESEKLNTNYFEVQTQVSIDLSKDCFCCNVTKLKVINDFIKLFESKTLIDKNKLSFAFSHKCYENFTNNFAVKEKYNTNKFVVNIPRISILTFLKPFKLKYNQDFLKISFNRIYDQHCVSSISEANFSNVFYNYLLEFFIYKFMDFFCNDKLFVNGFENDFKFGQLSQILNSNKISQAMKSFHNEYKSKNENKPKDISEESLLL